MDFNMVGRYEAMVQVWNGVGSECSSRIVFYVNSVNSYIDTTIKTVNNNHSIEVVPQNIDYGNNIVVSGYNNGKLISIDIKEYNEDVMKFQISADIDEVKIMVVEDLATMKPLCEAEVIPESEFIIN